MDDIKKRCFEIFSRYTMAFAQKVIPLFGVLVWIGIVYFIEGFLAINITTENKILGCVVFGVFAYFRSYWINFYKPKDKKKVSCLMVGDSIDVDLKYFYNNSNNMNSIICKELNQYWNGKAYIPVISKSSRIWFNSTFKDYPNLNKLQEKMLSIYSKISRSAIIIFGNATLIKDNKDGAYRITLKIYYDKKSVDKITQTIIESMCCSRFIIHDGEEEKESNKVAKIISAYICIADMLIERNLNHESLDLNTIEEIYRKFDSNDLKLDYEGSFVQILNDLANFLCDDLDNENREKAIKVLQICELCLIINPNNKSLNSKRKSLRRYLMHQKRLHLLPTILYEYKT